MKEFKVVVVGTGGVGKSALTVQFVQGMFVSNYDATIEDSYRKVFNADGEQCTLEILDTAGTEQFSGMRDLYIKNGEGFIIVFALNDENSYREVAVIRDTIVKIKNTEAIHHGEVFPVSFPYRRYRRQVPVVVVGNKADLHSDRRVSSQVGRQLCQKMGCSFHETSAKLNINVQDVFVDIVRQMKRLRGPARQEKRRTLRGRRDGEKEAKIAKNTHKKRSHSRKENKECCSIQ